MRAVLVMVGDVLGKQALQLPLVQSNHMVEQLATAARTQRSAIPFCQGLSNEVRTAFIFRDRMAAGSSVPYFASRSWIRISEPRQKEMPPATAGRMLRDVEVQGYGAYHG
jgi:hypothetical protein